jgi:hypothetical protein
VEDVVKSFGDRTFDLVFTMAVLEHIHTTSEWVFEEIVRITNRYVVTIEDERGTAGGISRETTEACLNRSGFDKSSRSCARRSRALARTSWPRVSFDPLAPTVSLLIMAPRFSSVPSLRTDTWGRIYGRAAATRRE